MIVISSRAKVICRCNSKIKNLNLEEMEYKTIVLKIFWLIFGIWKNT